MEFESHMTISRPVDDVYGLPDLEKAGDPGSGAGPCPSWPMRAPAPVLAGRGQRTWPARLGLIKDPAEAGAMPGTPRTVPQSRRSPR